jgi:hypothetical protein
LKQFKVVYKEGEIRKVEIYSLLKWLNAMYNFLKVELESIKAGDAIKIIALDI